MAADGTLEAFRTPGGHLRVTAESIEAAKGQRDARPRSAREPSAVLQNRRERLEELNLETQEHRARRELEKLRREEQEEADRLEAEAQAREEEAEQRQAQTELERRRLEHERAQERRRQDRERAQEQARRGAENAEAEFRSRWIEKANECAGIHEYRWLSAAQRKEVMEGLEAEIDRRELDDEPRMAAIIARTLAALIEPLKAERDAQERRERLAEQALWTLPYYATETEKAQVRAAVRQSLTGLDPFVRAFETQAVIQQAVQPIRQTMEKRRLDERMVTWAVAQLPWGRTDRDGARIRRECADILGDLPLDITELEAKEALESTIDEARQGIERRQEEEQRKTRRTSLIQQGINEVSSYMLELRQEGEISNEDYRDSEFTADLREAVRRSLESALRGDETTKKAQALARKIIQGELR
jgi:hypothetical protein